MTPDINFVRHRPLIRLSLKPVKQVNVALRLIGLAVSGAVLVSALTGYGALMLGRDVPTALALGSAGSVGLAANTKLKEH